MRWCAALLGLLAVAQAEGPLEQFGLGDPKQPVCVYGPFPPGSRDRCPRLASNGRRAPPETIWVFEDPTPVWRAIATGKARRFEAGKILDDGTVWLVVQPGRAPAQFGPRVCFHRENGLLTIEDLQRDHEMRGGTWTIGGETEEALVALLSKTEPRAIGGHHIWLDGARWLGPEDAGLEVRVVRSRERLVRLPRAFRPDIPTLPAKSDYDEPIELGPQAYVAVWTARKASRRDLHHARFPLISGKTLRWELAFRESRREQPGAPGLLGVFELPKRFTRVEIVLEDKPAAIVELDGNGEFLPGPETARIEVGAGVCVLHEGGAYTLRRPDAPARCGMLPERLRVDPDADALRRFLQSQ